MKKHIENFIVTVGSSDPFDFAFDDIIVGECVILLIVSELQRRKHNIKDQRKNDSNLYEYQIGKSSYYLHSFDVSG